jgi:hypothetical protein
MTARQAMKYGHRQLAETARRKLSIMQLGLPISNTTFLAKLRLVLQFHSTSDDAFYVFSLHLDFYVNQCEAIF